MGVQLFTLENRIVTSGGAAAISELQGVEAAGIRTAAGLNGLTGSLDRTASASLNGVKGFKDLSGAYANQDRVLSTLTPATAAATKEIEKGAEATKRHTGVLGGLTHELTRLATAYLGFKGLEFVHDTLAAAGALHELSQKTGASVETLSVLKFAGAQAGVSTEQVAIAFRGMALSLGNLRDGQDKTVEAYKRLGFTADSFKGLNPEQTFLKLATAVGGMKDEVERAEVAQRVFGRSGTALLPLLVDIAEKGFGAIRKETEDAGGMFTTDMANKADKFDDALKRLTGSFKVFLVEGLGPILPALTAFVNGLVKAIQLIKEVGTGGPGGWMAALMAGGLLTTRPHGKDPGGFRGDALGMGVNPLDALGTSSGDGGDVETASERKARIKKARDEYVRRVMGLANMDEAMRAPDKLAFQGVAASHLALRGGSVGAISGGSFGSSSPDTEFMGGNLEGDLSGIFADGGSGKSVSGRMAILQAFANEAKRQAVALKVQFATLGQSLGMTLAMGFSNALGAAMSGKNVFKAFGNVVLSGLGSIFSQMGKALLTAGIAMMKLLPFLSNPFTSGPAMIAAGLILTGVGAAMGGIATGHGGSGGGGGSGDDSFRDRTTQITLTAAGAGGMTAPHKQVGPTIHVLGKDSPEGQRMLGEYAAAAKRSRNM